MSKFNWDYDIPASVWKTQEMLSKLDFSIPALEISKAFELSIPEYNFDGISAALKDFATIADKFSDICVSGLAVQSLTDAIGVLPTIKIPSVVDTILPQIDTSAFDILKESAALASLAKVDWTWISEFYTDEEEDEEYSEDTDVAYVEEEIATAEIRAEIASDVSQVLSNPAQAHELSQSNYVKWKEQHPILADLYMQVLLPLLASLIFWAVSSCAETVMASANKNAKVYDEPSSSSNIVYNITVEQNVTIIGDTRYYYEVEVPDLETGEMVTGYVYKGNLSLDEPETPTDEVEHEEPSKEPSEIEVTTTAPQPELLE